ncbi:hypothetical protein EIN_474300 [Entamoeba invadens IP1]|uniref:Uncharacterized protein n=1 Tax=Entamoeba invadens IP1 TaxID=370355 RepID=A0A0A1U3Q2_ENTIV|nr:hypothetical protein EIN_474300 [Entamoeba invadens IP1]ELP88838.1 hypothetical protein EIN_474300 [Entamoeba invadens IP1]|eukprot:XP_004255609.1 hypothetical protein EIN_474300 [Entamoeba invadens IP1]
MDFWSTQGASIVSSTIDSLLKSPECTLEKLFDDAHYLLELKSNTDLIAYVLQDNNVEKCVEYICTDKSTLGAMAAQTFSLDVEIIQTTVVAKEEHIQKLFKTFVDTVDTIIVNNLVTVFTAFHKYQDFKDQLQKSTEVVDHLFNTLDQPVKSNYLIFLITSQFFSKGVMDRLLNLVECGKFIEHIELIFYQIIDWNTIITQSLYLEFTARNNTNYFEAFEKETPENKGKMLHILRILLPLENSFVVPKEFLSVFENNVERVKTFVLGSDVKKVSENILYFAHLVLFVARNNTSSLITMKDQKILDMFLELFLNPTVQSSVFRHYVFDIFNEYKNTEEFPKYVGDQNLTRKLIELDKTTVSEHYKYDIFMFGIKMMIMLFTWTSSKTDFQEFNEYVTSVVLPREENKTIYFTKKPTTTFSLKQNFVVDEYLDNTSQNEGCNESSNKAKKSEDTQMKFDFDSQNSFGSFESSSQGNPSKELNEKSFDFNDVSFGDFDSAPSAAVSENKDVKKDNTSSQNFNFGSFSFESSDFSDFK